MPDAAVLPLDLDSGGCDTESAFRLGVFNDHAFIAIDIVDNADDNSTDLATKPVAQKIIVWPVGEPSKLFAFFHQLSPGRGSSVIIVEQEYFVNIYKDIRACYDTLTMSLFALKLIALATMTVDHVGRFFFPGDIDWILVGRLAFPIFAWGIANGYHYTRSVEGYMSRLAIFALISQVPFTLAFISLGYNPWVLNIFFTLLIGLFAIYAYERAPSKVVGWGVVLLLALLATLLQTDYGFYGVLLTFVFHITYGSNKRMLLGQLLFWCILAIFSVIISYTALGNISYLADIPRLITLQVIALVSVVCIASYNGVQGPQLKWLFYWYYPLHLLVLLAIALLL